MLDLAGLVGILVFAISGVLAVAERQLDLFGVAVVGLVTAVGGGTIRAVVLDVPPAWVVDWTPLVVAVTASLATVLLVRIFAAQREGFQTAIVYADAAGLALFSVTGAMASMSVGRGGYVAVALGTVSAVGGGVIRDVLTSRPPLILQRDIYATASVAGATIFVSLEYWGALPVVAGIVSVVFTFTLRMVAYRYGWGLPVFRPPGIVAKLGKVSS